MKADVVRRKSLHLVRYVAEATFTWSYRYYQVVQNVIMVFETFRLWSTMHCTRSNSPLSLNMH
jgi:hypothetical protein